MDKTQKTMKALISAALCLILAFCCISCVQNNESTSESTEQTTDTNVTNSDEVYEKIISQYKELLLQKKNGGEISTPEGSDEITEALIYVVNGCNDVDLMGYATKDINRDGVDELVLLTKSHNPHALFTINNGEAVLLYKTVSMSAITPDGTVYYNEYKKDEYSIGYIQKLIGGRLEGLEFGTVINADDIQNPTYYNYKIENGVRSEITYKEISSYNQLLSPLPSTKPTGFRYINALNSNDQNTDSPKPDFSSYEGIIDAYKIIVGSFSDYTESKWRNGEFDSLFNISDNETYDIFHAIFYGGAINRPTATYYGTEYAEGGDNAYGYAMKDLNGDGIDELILLTDDYSIIALFTMKDGKVVLVDGATGSWIDEKGQLRIEKSTGGVVSRDGVFFIYQISDGSLEIVLGFGFKVNVYLEKEGWYRTDGVTSAPITNEEGESMYAAYDILHSGKGNLNYSSKEYMKSFSGIDFIPLFDNILATDKHLDQFSNSTSVGGSSITITDIDNSSVSFELDIIMIGDELTDPDNPFSYEVISTIISSKATLDGDVYRFDCEGIKGYIDFNNMGAWVIITESDNENVGCKAHLLDLPENNELFG